MSGKPIITYIRVSTSQQGLSGLGVEAQRAALSHFAKAEGLVVAREFVEIETGKGADALDRRPQLKARPPQPRCSFHFRPHGSQGPVLGRRAWTGRGPVCPAPLCCSC